MRGTIIPAVALTALAFATGSHAESYVTFQYAGTTYVTGINAGGAVTGFDVHTGGVVEDFIRNADGIVNFFTVPGDSGGFTPVGIGNNGAVTGSSSVSGSDYGKAFVRSSNGTIAVFT